MELGYTGQSFSWDVTDSYAGTFIIERDIVGVVEGPTPWVSGSGITYAIPDGLEVGEYLYMLNASDIFGNNITHVVTLTVEPDTTNPVITSIQDDITVEEGYSGQTLSWTTTDLFPATYTIELDGTGIVVDHTSMDFRRGYNILISRRVSVRERTPIQLRSMMTVGILS